MKDDVLLADFIKDKHELESIIMEELTDFIDKYKAFDIEIEAISLTTTRIAACSPEVIVRLKTNLNL